MSLRELAVSGLILATISFSTCILGDEKASQPSVAPFSGKNAEQHQQAWAKHLQTEVEITNSLGMKLRLIPAGEFRMGSPQSEKDRKKDETQHLVRISKAFYLGKYEVTQEEFRKVLGRNTSYFSAVGAGNKSVAGLNTNRLPVERVTWYDAVEFCNKLSEVESLPPYYGLSGVERYGDKSIKKAEVKVQGGPGYRLPTEAEWEYACRVGAETPFHFGTEINGREANIDGNYPYGTTTKGPDLERPTTVGEYPANKFGLHDMHGNVWEWCQDWYDPEYYLSSPSDNPTGPASAKSSRVLRGGSWYFNGWLTRSARRYADTPDLRSFNFGFRVARGVPVKTR
jgi:formylglycine-generating enzyme required for sulfatase activity